MKSSEATFLFDSEFMERELANFMFDSIPDVKKKKEIIRAWISELTSGRLAISKEEEIKPRFLQDIFGSVLGYAFEGANFWNARPEFKTYVDATKADAALGFFVLADGKIKGQVIAVVEIKDYNTDLDKSKNSKNQTAIEQAFEYANKTDAQWVIVSNFQELRLYNARFCGRWHSFWLKDFEKENELKALFLFLHRQFLIDGAKFDGVKSKVRNLYNLQESYPKGTFVSNHYNPNDHILDQMWKSLKQFEGITSIDPYIISNTPPFNILSDYVWHYDHFTLFTLNPKIYQFITHLMVTEEGNVISEELINELENQHVENFREKTDYVLRVLNAALIHQLSAMKNYHDIVARKGHVIGFSFRHIFGFSENDGITLKISDDNKVCNCANCSFGRLDLRKFLTDLKRLEDVDINSALSHYLVASNEFKKSFDLYSEIINNNTSDPTKRPESFIAQYNRSLMFRLIDFYDDPLKQGMLDKIRAIDLDEILYRDFASGERALRTALKEMHHDRVYERVKDKIETLVDKFKEIQARYDRGSGYDVVPNYTAEIHFHFCHLYAYVYRNQLLLQYQWVTAKMLEGLLISHRLKKYPYSIEEFSLLHILQPTLQVDTQVLSELLKISPSIKVNREGLRDYLTRVKAFLTSFYDVSLGRVSMNDLLQQHLLVMDFRDKCARIFSNIFLFLARVEMDVKEWDSGINPALVNFLEVQDFLYWYHLEKLGKFLVEKGSLFSAAQLEELLKVANKRNEHGITTYPSLIRSCAEALKKFYPEVKISNDNFLHKALADAIGENGRLRHTELLAIYDICSVTHQHQIRAALDGHMEGKFDTDCYFQCVHKGIYTIDYKNYFELYVKAVQASRGKGLVKMENFVAEFQDYIFYNFVILISRFDISRNDKRFDALVNLSPFEKWLFNPNEFDYKEFEPQWLVAADNYYIQEKFRSIDEVSNQVHLSLIESYNGRLSEIYFKFLAKKDSPAISSSFRARIREFAKACLNLIYSNKKN